MATTDLTRTPSSGGNRKTWTFSAWLKRASKSDSNNNRIFSAGGANSDYTSWFMYAVDGTDGILNFQNRISNITTSLTLNRKFRDVNGWYHLVIACDTTQATASNRVKIYINGVQETSFSTEQYPAQDADTFVNHTTEHNIGSADGAGYTPRYWAGSMTHVALVDGQQLTPTSFGETDSTSGIWKFKSPSGLSWGTNGFHLKFENSGNMGLDSSGQTNNYTVSGGTMTQILDTPANVHATWNPLSPNDSIAYSNGNATVTGSNATNYSISCSTTLGASSGKWYWEMKHTTANANTNTCIGVANLDNYEYNQNITLGTTGYVTLRFDGERQINGATTSSYFSTPSAGDILMCAMDMDNGKVFFGNNGTWFGSGNPVTGANPTADILTSGTWGGTLRYLAAKFECNFGNGFFGTTAVASAGSNGNGSIFEYDVPSGYYALNTKNINTYG